MTQNVFGYCYPRQAIPSNYILCGASALEFMGLFMGYLSEDLIYVYQEGNSLPMNEKNFVILPIPELDDKHVLEHAGIRYTAFDQTINDMLSNPAIEDPQAIMEALANYFIAYPEKEPEILPENREKYLWYKKASEDYFND